MYLLLILRSVVFQRLCVVVSTLLGLEFICSDDFGEIQIAVDPQTASFYSIFINYRPNCESIGISTRIPQKNHGGKYSAILVFFSLRFFVKRKVRSNDDSKFLPQILFVQSSHLRLLLLCFVVDEGVGRTKEVRRSSGNPKV